ncbi:DUF7674 family protein [Dyadobacter frigoris]|uniref:DUF7674 domain-containing protein n=1 Tax=Dyadobacter frigoris TaxID=2576211 RepID=A0A4U6CV03_9BACT|nr:hypothetical protein [Dyadobacter frigoris]TKT87565.1 hypothetical protein FDK13_28610 [Dyadobacter frigoris]GLU57456.1 hypothetical protein Dfri01_69170 [Dyadobacter frigoris]
MRNKLRNSVYKQMQQFAALTVTFVLSGNAERTKRCLNAVEKLYLNGSYQTRNAITNVYVYNLSMILELHHIDVQKIFPAALRAEYIKQINAY